MTDKSLRFVACLVALVIGVSRCGGGDASKGESSVKGKGSVARFRTVSYTDEQAGVEAFRLLAPEGWQFDGGVKWLLDNPSMPAAVSFRVYNPNGAEEFEVFPNQPFFWTDNQMTASLFPPGSRYFGNEVRQPVSALSALKNIVLPRFRGSVGDLEIATEQDLPELAKAVGAGMQSQPGLKASADGAKVRVTYSKGGREMEEELYCVVEELSFPLQTMSGWRTNTIWFVDYIFSFKALKGQLDARSKLFQAVAYSVKVNPVWYSKYNQVIEYLAQRQIQQIHSVGEMSRILSQTSNEISDMMMETYNRRQEANDRIAENFSQYVRGVDQYQNPFDEKGVELPSGYNHAWVNNNGEYVLTDDPNFNPGVGSNLHWQEMPKTK